MNIPVAISIPDLWGAQQFTKNDWGSVNFLVGPNGTGKTRFAAELKKNLATAGLKPRYLSAERLAGLEKAPVMGYSGALAKGFNFGEFGQYKRLGAEQGLAADAFVILKEKINVRVRIEAFLSSVFGRRIRFAEEGGFLKPKLQRVVGGSEYELKENECHGLKELIALLSFLYDDDFSALIIDEPELHLHPQFQTFLLAEMRRIAGDPREVPQGKVIFIITHSPYLLDFRSLDDLRQCVMFHPSLPPTYIGDLSAQDEYCLTRLLPRLNTHHKQFFFASRPIFVEGYTDQQVFSLIQEGRSKLLGATGSCFIDVNGKDEQDFFFRICRKLQIDAQFISDLDVLTRGGFRLSISGDERCRRFITSEGIGTDLMNGIRDMNNRIDLVIQAIGVCAVPSLDEIKSAIQAVAEVENKRYRVAVAIIHHRQLLLEVLVDRTAEIDFIAARIQKLICAAREAGVFLLPNGALENHLESYDGPAFQVSDRAKLEVFEAERQFLLSGVDVASIQARYETLIPILDQASGVCEVDLKKHLGYLIGEMIGNVQRAFERGEINSPENLKEHALVDWKTFDRIVEVISFVPTDRAFACSMKLKRIAGMDEFEFDFADTTVHSKFLLGE